MAVGSPARPVPDGRCPGPAPMSLQSRSAARVRRACHPTNGNAGPKKDALEITHQLVGVGNPKLELLDPTEPDAAMAKVLTGHRQRHGADARCTWCAGHGRWLRLKWIDPSSAIGKSENGGARCVVNF